MKKILFAITLFIAMFMFAPNVWATDITGDSFLNLSEDNGNYTITLLKDTTSTEVTTIFNTWFPVMKSGNITIAGNNYKITNDGTNNSMIPIYENGGVAAVYDPSTEKWTTATVGYNHQLKFENVSFVGSGTSGAGSILVYIVLPAADVTFDGCSFESYTKAAIWTANFNSMTVNNCSFNGNSVNPSATDPTLYGQSSESISFCLGDEFEAGSSAYGTHQISNITVTNSTFKNIQTTTPNGTSAIKLKIKNKTLVTGVDNILIKNNTFSNNLVDMNIGEKTPEVAKPSARPTTADETADLNVTFNNNTSTNGGVKIVSVHNISVPEADRTYLIPSSTDDVLFNVVKKVELKKDGATDLSLTGNTGLKDALTYIANDARANGVTGLNIKGQDYNIHIAKEDISGNLSDGISDLGLTISQSVEDQDLNKYAGDNVLFLTTNVSGMLPASKITVTVKVNFAEGSQVKLYYYNEAKKLEELGTYTVTNGTLTFDLTHYSSYVLEATTVQEKVVNPNTSDAVILYVILSIISLTGITGSILYNKKEA